jgi:hypothetical protein
MSGLPISGSRRRFSAMINRRPPTSSPRSTRKDEAISIARWHSAPAP